MDFCLSASTSTPSFQIQLFDCSVMLDKLLDLEKPQSNLK